MAKKHRRKIASRRSMRTRLGKDAYEAHKAANSRAKYDNGVKQVAAELRAEIAKLLEQVALDAAPAVLAKAKDLAPVGTGALRDSIIVAPMRDGRVILRARVWYANMVHKKGSKDRPLHEDYSAELDAAVASVKVS